MPLPRVSVVAQPGEPPLVAINGVTTPAVRSVQVTAASDGFPQVALVMAAGHVDLDIDGQITVMRAAPSAAEFADQLDVQRLEHDALEYDDEDATQGEAFAHAVMAQARDFDDRG